MVLTSGTHLGPYEILGAIGAGGMGEVYRARDVRLGRDVAIKILPEGFATDPDRLARFEREGRAVAALSHPNILAIYDFGREGVTAYAVMELLEGQTLRDRLAQGALPPREAIACAVQIAHGLAAAHDKGIAHRDLKPENLFVAADGRVKILDFGLAKLLDPGGDQMTGAGTSVGSVMGTVGYMSPEQVRGQTVDHRADIFALGAVLHEMLSGRGPFHADSAADTMSATLNADPPDLDQLGTGVPPALARIVQRCLEKRPEARFQSAHDLAFALESSGSRSRAIETRGTGWRRARPWTLAAGLVITLTALFWWSLSKPAPPTATSAEAPSRLAIAVLPFQNLSAAESNAYLAIGLHDELLTQLAKVASLSIVPTIFLLLFIPMWVSEVLRSFAWFIILSFNGPLNLTLIGLGVIEDKVRWMTGFRSVIIGLVYTYVLFMLFPVYNAVQSLDSNQIEASEDLGAPWWRTHWRVILPHAKPGIASGAVMVFMLSAGSLLVPSLLGSTTSGWFTQTIQGVMLEEQDWNSGAAFAFMLLLVCTIVVSLAMKVFGVKLSDIAK